MHRNYALDATDATGRARRPAPTPDAHDRPGSYGGSGPGFGRTALVLDIFARAPVADRPDWLWVADSTYASEPQALEALGRGGLARALASVHPKTATGRPQCFRESVDALPQ